MGGQNLKPINNKIVSAVEPSTTYSLIVYLTCQTHVVYLLGKINVSISNVQDTDITSMLTRFIYQSIRYLVSFHYNTNISLIV